MVFSEFSVYICHDQVYMIYSMFFFSEKYYLLLLVIYNQQFQGTIILTVFDLRGDGKVSIYHPLTRRPGNKVSQGAGSPMLNMPLWRVTE